MDYYQQQNTSSNNESPYGHPDYPMRTPGLTMATISLFLGLGALFTVLSVFLPLALGGLAILFALLSKGYGKKMLTQAKIGFGCGIAGLALVIVMFISSFAMIFSNPDILVDFGKQYDAACEEIYGQPSEDLFGYSFEDMMEEYADAMQ